MKILHRRIAGATAIVLGVHSIVGCINEPPREARITTALALRDTVVVPGDTVSGVLYFANEGRAPRAFVAGCPQFRIQVLDSLGEDLSIFSYPCPAAPTDDPEPVATWVLGAGDTIAVSFLFRAEFYTRQGLLVPCPAGKYTVAGGLNTWPRELYRWARRDFVVSAGQNEMPPLR